MKHIAFLVALGGVINLMSAQSIADFISVAPGSQDESLHLPPTHTFQVLIRHGDALTSGGVLPDATDFTGYVPINGRSDSAYLSINSEKTPGGNTVLDIRLNSLLKQWEVLSSTAIDFSPVGGTRRNCSGAITPWGTVLSCEERVQTTDNNGDGYYDMGWAVEIDLQSKTVIDKCWAMGCFVHENAAVHANQRTVYQGADVSNGYLFKFVANTAGDLSSGSLYVYSGSKSGSGSWLLLNNTTKPERNSTNSQAAALGATTFNGIEDVEIGPNGKIYFAVKGESRVYRFQDSDPITGTTVTGFETYVGNTSYLIDYGTGSSWENWGSGNDNLAFDGDGNLWVLQDGGNDYIWVVKAGHTQANPLVEIFARTPDGSEPTGITFSPDYKYLFMSIQHPNSSNSSSSQYDAFCNLQSFDRDQSIVIALLDNLGTNHTPGLCGVPLPVSDFLTFKATPGNEGILLEWTTEEVEPGVEFTIERKYGNADFLSIATLSADGDRSALYQLWDTNPVPGLAFYRIIQNAPDGSTTYSHIEEAFWDHPWGVEIFPNPIRRIQQLQVNFIGWPERSADIKVYSLKGEVVFSHQGVSVTSSSGAWKGRMELPRGIYLIEISSESHQFMEKLLVR